MRQLFILLCCGVLLLTGCHGREESASPPAAAVAALPAPAQIGVDFLHGDVPWDDTVSWQLDAYPGVEFRWTSDWVTAVADGQEEILFYGMPVWNVLAADLNGDDLPELCATTSFGSGIVDNRVVVYDYAARQAYELSDRCRYDYEAKLLGERLVVTRTPYDVPPDDSQAVVGCIALDPAGKVSWTAASWAVYCT